MTDDHTRQRSWPREVDRVLAANGDWRTNASVNWGGDTLYLDGYKTAADTLVNHVARDRYESDTLVYPIVFSYRQYLELLLKALLAEARERSSVEERIPAKHQLPVIWQPLRALLDESWPDIDAELAAVDDVVGQLDRVDPASIAFRYPTTTKGERSLPPELILINLRDLAELVARAGHFLEGCYEQLSGERDAREYERAEDDHAADHDAYHAA